MAFQIAIREEAKNDLAAAMEWYSSKSENLDIKFLEAVEDSLYKIRRNPFAFKRVYKQFRQTAVKKFPYVIVYKPEENFVIIYAVFNTWQNPKKKLSRIRKF